MKPGDEVVSPPTAGPVPLTPTAAATGPERPLAAPVVIRRTQLLDLRPPLVTALLVSTNLIWYVVGLVTAIRHGMPFWSYLWHGNPVVIWWLGAVAVPDLLRGDWSRLLSCCFVHGMVWHLALNLISLAMAGSLAELFWGRWRVLLVYLFAGLGGSCLAMALRPTAVVGASGAVWGLLTAIVAWLLIFHRSLDRGLVTELAWRLGLGFLLSVGLSLVPGVSWEAHAGGGMVGFVAAGLLALLRFGSRVQRIAAAVLLLALPVLCVGGLVWAMKSGPSWAAIRARMSEPPRISPRPVPTLGRQVPDPAEKDLPILLAAISPEQVGPISNEAVILLARTPTRRSAADSPTREKVALLLAAATQAANRLARPIGNPVIDANRARVKAFADARVKSLTLLLNMLDADTIPDAATWKAWGDNRREADRRWRELNRG